MYETCYFLKVGSACHLILLTIWPCIIVLFIYLTFSVGSAKKLNSEKYLVHKKQAEEIPGGVVQNGWKLKAKRNILSQRIPYNM